MTVDVAARPAARDTTVRVMRLLWLVTCQTIAGYLLVMVVVFALIGVGRAAFGTMDQSVWDWASQSPKYFNVAVGIMLTPVALTMLVAHGITRRAFAIAGSAFLLVVALGTSLLWVAGYLVEWVIYELAGWPQKLTHFHLFDSATQAGLILLEFFPLILAHQTTGWLIGTSFTRYGWWGGIVFLPISLLPATASELLLLTQWVGELLTENGWDRLPLAIGAPGALLVCAAGLYLNYLLLRPIGLKPTRG